MLQILPVPQAWGAALALRAVCDSPSLRDRED
jgi:hypothetical protein